MNLLFDLKYAWRLARKSWGYTLMCVGVVALSVGLAVWTNTLSYSQMFKPLGFPGSERWYSVQIGAKAETTAVPAVDAYTYQEMLKQTRSADCRPATGSSPPRSASGRGRSGSFSSRGAAAHRLQLPSIQKRLRVYRTTPPRGFHS